MTTVSIQKRLFLRQLDPEHDEARLNAMDFGDRYWEIEVGDFAHNRAIQHEIKGNCSTTLAFDARSLELVGLLATDIKPLEVNRDFLDLFEISNTRRPMRWVNAGFVTAFGVDRRFQRQGHGHEIFLSYLESLKSGFQRPRFVYLEVFKHSPAARLYEEDWKFRRLGVTAPGEGDPDSRLRLALDRYQRPKGKP